MARVFRKITTRALPDGATVKGDVAKWKPRGSERYVTAPATKHADGRTTVAAASATWHASYREADGRLVTVNTKCRDESNARLWLAAAVKRVEQVAAGVLTPIQAKAAGRSREALADHFEAFVGSIRGKRGGPPSDVHVANTRRYLVKLAADCDWRTLGDVTRETMDAWIKSQQRPGLDGLAIRSASSVNHHVEAVVAFCRWASDPRVGRMPSNPLGTVPKANVDIDPRRRRRALSPDELVRLCRAAMNAPRHGRAKLDGPSRAFLWLFLAGSGWRVGEVRALKVRDVLLNASPPVIRLPAAHAKARRAEAVPIRSDLLPGLAHLVEGKAPDAPVFVVPSDLSKRFDQDCKRAGIPKRDARNRTVDVHSLRTTLGTAFAASGAPIPVAMRGMRHSTAKLTESTYVDPELIPVAAALEATINPELAALFARPEASFAGIPANERGTAPAEPAEGAETGPDAPDSFAAAPASFAASFAVRGGDSRANVTTRDTLGKMGGRKEKAPGVA